MDYSKTVETVKRLITVYGRTVQMVQLKGSPLDPTKPWRGAGAPAPLRTLGARAVFVPTSGNDLGMEWVPDKLLARANEMILVAPGIFDYSEFNVVIDEGVHLGIEWIQGLKPGDTTLLYAMGIMR